MKTVQNLMYNHGAKKSGTDTYEYGQDIGEYGVKYITNSLVKIGENKSRCIWALCPMCKKEWVTRLGHVLAGKSKRCCYYQNRSKDSPIYQVWKSMRARCNNPKLPTYMHYGGRGITVCDRWNTFRYFEEEMLPTYKKGLQIDRIDNDDGYHADNCRWATPSENCRNRRSNHRIEYQGLNLTIAEWVERTPGLTPIMLQKRLKKGLTGANLFAPSKYTHR